MRILQTKVYPYAELSDKAKERAREWFASNGQNDFDHVLEDAAIVADMLGIDQIKIYYSGFYSQGDGACFEGTYKYKPGAVAAIKSYAPVDAELLRIASALQALQKPYFYQLRAIMAHRGHYYHSGCMTVDAHYSNDRYRAIDESSITQLMRDFADWLYSQLDKENDYQLSDETIAENIQANEYEFTENGAIV